MHTSSAQLHQIYHSPSGDVAYLLFKVAQPFDFLEGQFVMIAREINGKLVKKPYSIATTNRLLREEDILGVVVKKTSVAGMSHRLTYEIQHGDIVHLQGALGHYTDDQRHTDYLLISTGSGLSPNLGLFQHLVYESSHASRIINIFGEKYASNIVPHVHDLLTQHGKSWVKNMFHLSQESTPPTGYLPGRITMSIAAAVEELGTQIACFVCGHPDMVGEVRPLLASYGIDKENITFEKY